jgi:hypothetical protein
VRPGRASSARHHEMHRSFIDIAASGICPDPIVFMSSQHSRILSLFRRCLRSAAQCPDLQQRRIMKDYTIGRFRSALAPGVRLEQTIKYAGISRAIP